MVKKFRSHQEVEQDKFRAIFWKQPLETNKTFSEGINVHCIVPLILQMCARCQNRERVSVN